MRFRGTANIVARVPIHPHATMPIMDLQSVSGTRSNHAAGRQMHWNDNVTSAPLTGGLLWRCQTAFAHPSGLNTRSIDAGNLASFSAGLRGRAVNSPPQFGHLPLSTVVAQSRQNVHSNEQMSASCESGGRSRSQHSQFGRSWSMEVPPCLGLPIGCCLTIELSGRTTAALPRETRPTMPHGTLKRAARVLTHTEARCLL